MKHTDIKKLFDGSMVGSDVTVCGWVRTCRDSKNMAFLELNDGTTLNHLQVVIDKSVTTGFENCTALGCAIKAEGTLVAAAKGAGVEINAKKLTLLGDCPPDYPMQKKRHTMEYLRTIPHLRVRTNTFNAMLRVRSVLSYAIHRYFQQNDYVYVHTPLITGSDCEGAGEVFRVTTHDWNYAAKSQKEYFDKDFFGQFASLTVSGQLEGEMAAMAMGKIYTFGPTFRAENSNTTRHAAEFWQIEPEVAFAELPDIIEIAEELIKYIINAVLTECPEEIKFFDERFEKGLEAKLRRVVESEFKVLDYTEAVEILKKSGKTFVYPVEWGCDLQTEHERYLTEEVFNKPVFVTNYPKDIKAFYMKQNPDGKTVAATDLLVPGIGEIIGCSEREVDADKLAQAMEQRGIKVAEYENYMALRKFGACPHSGFGLGLERILLYVTGLGNIRDVQLFPRTVGDLK